MDFKQRISLKLNLKEAEGEKHPGQKILPKPTPPPTTSGEVTYKGFKYRPGGAQVVQRGKPAVGQPDMPGYVPPEQEKVVRHLLAPKGGELMGVMTQTGDIMKVGDQEMIAPSGTEAKPTKPRSTTIPKMPEAKGWDITWFDPHISGATRDSRTAGETILLDHPQANPRPCTVCKGSGTTGINPDTKRFEACRRCYGVGQISDYVDRIVAALGKKNVKVRPAVGKEPKFMPRGKMDLP